VARSKSKKKVKQHRRDVKFKRKQQRKKAAKSD
jgi:hypothetical protein